MNLKTPNDIKILQVSGRILTEVLETLRDSAEEDISLLYLEKKARNLIKKAGAKPAFLGYKQKNNSKPYPAAICTSVNDVIVHGIPNEYVLQDGDVLKIDLGVNYKNYITDAALTLGIGRVSPLAEKLIKATRAALTEAKKMCKPRKKTGDIGWVIQKTVKNYGFSVIQKLTGHGVGFELHEFPNMPNIGEKNTGVALQEGMVIALEPMVAVGTGEIIEREDGSFATKDRTLSAHFEETIAITKNGALILTPIQL